ncbi:hypothetical protein CHOED_068 [Vibrio phage CHOED]|nr:hypothetical protein CHOED_068 [Vibrio phage CHOED]AHK11928.1 hypothetical protein CHOED_068 [Vibrio phage CHOED]
MSANKRGNAPVKASVKRMHRPSKMLDIENGRTKIAMFFSRIGVWAY